MKEYKNMLLCRQFCSGADYVVYFLWKNKLLALTICEKELEKRSKTLTLYLQHFLLIPLSNLYAKYKQLACVCPTNQPPGSTKAHWLACCILFVKSVQTFEQSQDLCLFTSFMVSEDSRHSFICNTQTHEWYRYSHLTLSKKPRLDVEV